MQIQGLYAAMYVKDIASSVVFYTKVLGRAPDDKPFETLVQWRGFGNAGIQLFEDARLAGQGRMTIVVPDMAQAQALLGAANIELTDLQSGGFGKVAQLRDPDGNIITLAEPPR